MGDYEQCSAEHTEGNKMKEIIWKRYENTNYLISSEGEVYSENKAEMLAINTMHKGYAYVTLWINGVSERWRLHRLVATVFIPNPEGKLEINHLDGNKLNNCVANLEWCTRAENALHAMVEGLYLKGEEVYNAKLTVEKVSTIKELMVAGLSNQEIANRYGVDNGGINAIRKLKNWKHVRPELVLPFTSPGRGGAKAKLKPEDIPTIRKLASEGLGCAAIGREFDVNKKTIYSILSGKTWKNY